MYSTVVLLALAGCAAASVIGVNPNALNVPLDTATVALAKNAQLVQQAAEGTRNILGGGIPAALPADTHEVAAGKVAHAIAIARQKATIAGAAPILAAPAVAAVGPAVAAAPLGIAASGLIAPRIAAPGLLASGIAAAPLGLATSGLIAPGIAAPGLLGNGLVATGLLGNGLVAPGILGNGLVAPGLVSPLGLGLGGHL